MNNPSLARTAVFLSGKGSNFEAILDAFEKKGVKHPIVCVVTDNPAARGAELAREKGIPVAVVERRVKEQSLDAFNEKLIEALAKHNPDFLVLAGFMQILNKQLIDNYKNRIINIHPSLLPAFQGKNAVKQALDAGVRITGCTIHLVTPEVDAGAIIAQSAVEVFESDTQESLTARLQKVEHVLYPEVIFAWMEDKIYIEETNGQTFVRSKCNFYSNVKDPALLEGKKR